jgi:SagB-type dehydrogenase family enzyme
VSSDRPSPTAEFASVVYGPQGVPLDDPAEAFHEASRLYPNIAPARLATLLALTRNAHLRQTAERSSRTHDHRPGIDLPAVEFPGVSLRQALHARRSAIAEAPSPLRLADLGTLLGAAYSAHPRPDVTGPLRRPVPSAGALYPLELYVIALSVDGLDRAVSHYNPFRHRLEQLRPFDEAEIRAAMADPGLIAGTAALIVVTAMFWRSRFKYGIRGYRFVLLEAGHAVQNAVLAAAALGIEALPLGGFYDRILEMLVGADGLDEAAVYGLLVGGSA